MIVVNHAKAVNAKLFFHFGKIVIKKLFKNSKVVFSKLVNTTNASTFFFASDAKRIFAAYQNISKVVVPQVSIKTAYSCHVQKFVDLLIDAGTELFLLIVASVKFFANISHREQQIICVQVSINYQF